ncbi:hypothetical protein K504DRAFT_260228 [Pleomassaria siparia CBS 279.74]|uniref:L domain-like protein n=1 Tax=Pleomassaria siparia CBS 279.74 TaxID=1314801 RepID=A0A6G1KC67_9PLEO|nr:hypothetical protein K504DRAFT_260228 [Pleomassaria siparia CBS 279.74]
MAAKLFPNAHIPSSPPFLSRIYDECNIPSSEPPTSPPLFSSDDPPEEEDLSNYETPRVKRKYAGAWWTSDNDTTPVPRKKSKLSRDMRFDSGCWPCSDMISDEEEEQQPLLAPRVVPNVKDSVRDRERIRRETSRMSFGEALIYNDIQKGVVNNKTVYVLRGLNLSDSEIRHVGELNQVIQPPPDPGADVPEEGQYRSMVPEIRINLDANLLSRLTLSLFSLKHLTRLTLRGNNIHELPPQIAQLRSLKELDVNWNPISYLPAEILRMLTPHGNLDYLGLTASSLLVRKDSWDSSELDACTNNVFRPEHGNFNQIDDKHKLFHRLRSVDLPRANSANLDTSFIFPFIEAIKELETMTISQGLPKHHRLSEERTMPHTKRTYLGSTAISYYNQVGRLVKNSPKFATSDQEPFDLIVRIADQTSGPSSYGAPQTWYEPPKRHSVHSLFKIAFNQALKHDPPTDIEAKYMEDFMPAQGELMMTRAHENIAVQFEPLLTCYCCHRRYTVVAAEWVEFWVSNHPSMDKSVTSILPFRVQVCSWGCVPDELAARP